MANQPRADNPHRSIRVEDLLWETSERACAELGATRADVMRKALRRVVEVADNPNVRCEWGCDD